MNQRVIIDFRLKTMDLAEIQEETTLTKIRSELIESRRHGDAEMPPHQNGCFKSCGCCPKLLTDYQSNIWRTKKL